MAKRIDMTGERFGLLVVKCFSHVVISGKRNYTAHWQCQCDCGTETIVSRNNLINGSVASCGCARFDSESMRQRATIHGHKAEAGGTPTYRSWYAMYQRCCDPNNIGYANYGGRGVKICERWSLFENFLEDMGLRPEGKTLDRYPNPDGDYELSNCRWATPYEQRHNRRKK